MKNKIITLSVFIYIIHTCLFAQLDCDLSDIHGVEVSLPVPKEYSSIEFTGDIWPMPSLVVDRSVAWVHGLGGSGDEESSTYENSWIQASSATDVIYQTVSHRPSYTDVGLTAAAYSLKSKMLDYGTMDNNSIIIAHSQGGIVSRRYDQILDDDGVARTFGGLVTFGSPHQGARIINNIDEFDPWLSETCEALSAGPIEESVSLGVVLTLISPFISEEEIVDFFCDVVLTDFIAPQVTGALEAPIGSDYAVGATELADLNSYEPTIPYVCFYGIETEPEMWNTMVHFIPGHKPNESDAFMANNDSYLTDYANNEMNNYYAKYLEWDASANYWDGFMDDWSDWGLAALCWFCPFGEAELDLIHAQKVRDDYKLGYDWWVDANPTWKSIIGQDTYVASEDCYCSCIFETGGDHYTTTHPNPDCGECNEMWGDCSNIITYTMETKQSDGVVLVESASNVLGMTYNAPMNDSNHFSMRNDHNTSDRLTELFNGDYGYFFKTLER